MNVTELISLYDEQRPNKISEGLKKRWIEDLERQLMYETVSNHSGDPRFTPETKDRNPHHEGATPRLNPDDHFKGWDDTTELIAQPPYHYVYIYWLDLQNAVNQNDTKRYNMSMSLYNNALQTFQKYYNRTYRPLYKHSRILKHRWWE